MTAKPLHEIGAIADSILRQLGPRLAQPSTSRSQNRLYSSWGLDPDRIRNARPEADHAFSVRNLASQRF
jgi:hypothetical protein